MLCKAGNIYLLQRVFVNLKDDDMCYLPLKEEDVWIRGYWLKRKGYVLNEREKAFIRYLKEEDIK